MYVGRYVSSIGISRGVGGGGVFKKFPFRGRGMDIFWNYTLDSS